MVTRDEHAWSHNVREAGVCDECLPQYPKGAAAEASQKYPISSLDERGNFEDVRALFGVVCQTLSPLNQKESVQQRWYVVLGLRHALLTVNANALRVFL
jgi:hypothetical protein